MSWVPDFDLSQDWIAFVVTGGGITMAAFPPSTIWPKVLWIGFYVTFGLVLVYINSKKRQQKRSLEVKEQKAIAERQREKEEDCRRLKKYENKMIVGLKLGELSFNLDRFIEARAFELDEVAISKYGTIFAARIERMVRELKNIIYITDLPLMNVFKHPSSLEIIRDIQLLFERILNEHFRGEARESTDDCL